MNVYINKHKINDNVSIIVLVAANSPKEAWNILINSREGQHYYTNYNDFEFRLIEKLSYNSTEPKIIQETAYIIK